MKYKNCRSCWAFSAIAAIEGQLAKKSGTYLSLSDQQIISCSVSNGGCNGGDPELAYDDIIATSSKGIDSYSSYPVSFISVQHTIKPKTYY